MICVSLDLEAAFQTWGLDFKNSADSLSGHKLSIITMNSYPIFLHFSFFNTFLIVKNFFFMSLR